MVCTMRLVPLLMIFHNLRAIGRNFILSVSAFSFAERGVVRNRESKM